MGGSSPAASVCVSSSFSPAARRWLKHFSTINVLVDFPLLVAGGRWSISRAGGFPAAGTISLGKINSSFPLAAHHLGSWISSPCWSISLVLRREPLSPYWDEILDPALTVRRYFTWEFLLPLFTLKSVKVLVLIG